MSYFLQYFEQDDPELYLSKVKYILDNDLDQQSCAAELYFVEDEYDKTGHLVCSVDLIPNGNHIKVPDLLSSYFNQRNAQCLFLH